MNSCRAYHISDNTRTIDEAYTYCQDLDLGLAMWDDAESYEDMKYLSTTAAQADLYTALNNDEKEDCNGCTYTYCRCDNKLIWRQTQTGPREYFQRNAAYNTYVI